MMANRVVRFTKANIREYICLQKVGVSNRERFCKKKIPTIISHMATLYSSTLLEETRYQAQMVFIFDPIIRKRE